MTIKQWIKTPKSYVFIIMIFFLLFTSIGTHSVLGLWKSLVAVFVCVLLDIILCLMEKRKRIFPDGAVISGLIIAFILSTTTSVFIIAATAAIAILSKHILKYKKKPIFNPAAFGLFVSILLFHSQQSWWGAFGDLPAWTILFLLVPGYIVTIRVNKFPQLFIFLGTTFALLFLMGQLHIGDSFDALRPPFINATLFFSFFMLTDPPTTPATDKDQMIFSIIVAIVGTVIYALYGGLMYLFVGLFAGNLYHFVKKRFFSQKLKTRPKMRQTNRLTS
ncbi:MAG: RnfABCDGE type electron transport complex subunit D [Heyndrickxia sp.]